MLQIEKEVRDGTGESKEQNVTENWYLTHDSSEIKNNYQRQPSLKVFHIYRVTGLLFIRSNLGFYQVKGGFYWVNFGFIGSDRGSAGVQEEEILWTSGQSQSVAARST